MLSFFVLFVPGLPPACFCPCRVAAVKLNDPVLPFTNSTLEPVILPDYTVIMLVVHVPSSINVRPSVSVIQKCH